MRWILILVITTFTMNVFGQIDGLNAEIVFNPNKSEKIEEDTIPKIFYINTNDSYRTPAFYINGKFISETVLNTINPQLIDSIKVVKRNVEIDGKNYYGQIFIKLKKNYNPKLISLTDLKLKHTNLKNTSSIFMIDNEIINGDYNKYIVDKNYILKTIIEKIDNKEENLQVNIIRLLTKTEENIKKSKQKFFNIKTNGSRRTPAYYNINGRYISGTLLKSINPQLFDSLKVVRRNVEIDGQNYYKQIFIKLKKNYKPKLISLTDLKLKYTNLTNTSSIFMIDNEIIDGDYNKYIVDENYILKILIEKIDNKEENLQVNIIRLLTKTEKNIEESKRILIRGSEELMIEK